MNQYLFGFIALLLLLAACEKGSETPAAQTPKSATGESVTESTTADRPSGEQLLGAPPRGWKEVFSSSNPGLRMAEFIPEDQDNDSWSQKITFESLNGKPVPDPIEFLEAISVDQRGTCEGFESYSTFSGFENGYPTSIQLLICARSRIIDQSQVTMIKAIAGNDNFYTISRAQRGPALTEDTQALSETEIAGWSLYLRAITVCDTGSSEHECPDEH
jgi:hypothetical protein